jgi:hypothetical protein
MKNSMKSLSLLLIGMLLVGGVSSCKEDGPHTDPIVRFVSTINTSNTQPRAVSSAQGSAVMEYNKDTRTLSYNITYQGLRPTSAAIHSAQPYWENGPIEFNLSNVGTSPITGSVVLNPRQETLLMLNSMYINIVTQENPYGEIRGQVELEKFGNL